LILALVVIGSTAALHAQVPPPTYDLRDVNGENYVTSVKSQTGGTCWTHGVMAAMEGNLLITGNWAAAGEVGEPALAEYHLDWWNGFNQHNNDDTVPPTGGGLTVHEGGDYLVAAAYLTRLEGAVREVDGQSYSSPPLRNDPSFHHYYPRHIEWFNLDTGLVNINTIKEKIMQNGVMGTCLCSSSSYIQNYIHYQPPSTTADPNHAVAIIGWDDNKVTQAPQPGAWLCKNSWGASWGLNGFFWISYYDKHCGRHPEMGSISYQDVEPLAYDFVHYHDYHAWRDTLLGTTEAFNAFTASHGSFEQLEAVSFFTATENVSYTVKIYDRFESGQLLDELASESGSFDYRGFHTVDLSAPLTLAYGEDFYVYLYLSDGGHPYDCTSDVPVLLGSSARVIVESASNPGESLYKSGGSWLDLYDLDDSANFCIKALGVEEHPLGYAFPQGLPDGELFPPGLETDVVVEITDGFESYVPGSGTVHYRIDPADPFIPITLTSLGGDLYGATLPNTVPGDEPEFYFSAQGSGGTTVVSPLGAPANTYGFDVAFVELLMEDDFETAGGWSVQNVSIVTGAWERADPQLTDAQPGDDHTPTGTLCYVTGPLAGSGVGDYDVDGGPTRLISPVIDLSTGDALVSFYYWFYHSTNGTVQPFEIEVSNNNGSTWTGVASLNNNPAWTEYQFKVSDHVTPTSQVLVRFSATDNPNDSVVEALVDDFKVERYNTDATLWADGYEITASAATVIDMSLDAGAANAGRPYLLLGTLSGTSPGFPLPGGQVLPINWDLFTDLILAVMHTPVFQNFLGNLDGMGTATATLDTLGPINPAIIGATAHFAYTLGSPFDFTSNPIPVTFE
jgi:C1A family cysteine protease